MRTVLLVLGGVFALTQVAFAFVYHHPTQQTQASQQTQNLAGQQATEEQPPLPTPQLLEVKPKISSSFGTASQARGGKMGKMGVVAAPRRLPPKAKKRFYRRGLIVVNVYAHSQRCRRTYNYSSLRCIVIRIAKQHGWNRVVWEPNVDYRWYGKAHLKAYTLQGIFNQLLAKYPVQARFYQGNHVLAIFPRTLQ